MQTQKEGQFQGKVTQARFIEHRFEPPEAKEVEVSIEFVTEEGETGAIYLSLTNSIVDGGNDAGRKEYEVSMEKLSHYGVDLSSGAAAIKSLNAKMISVFGKRNKSGYLNFYLNTSKPKVEVSEQIANDKLKSLFAPPVQNGGFGQQQGGSSDFPQAQAQSTFSQ